MDRNQCSGWSGIRKCTYRRAKVKAKAVHRAAFLHRSNSADMPSRGPFSVSDRLRSWCSEPEHAVEYVAGESGLSALMARVACAQSTSEGIVNLQCEGQTCAE